MRRYLLFCNQLDQQLDPKKASTKCHTSVYLSWASLPVPPTWFRSKLKHLNLEFANLLTPPKKWTNVQRDHFKRTYIKSFEPTINFQVTFIGFSGGSNMRPLWSMWNNRHPIPPGFPGHWSAKKAVKVTEAWKKAWARWAPPVTFVGWNDSTYVGVKKKNSYHQLPIYKVIDRGPHVTPFSQRSARGPPKLYLDKVILIEFRFRDPHSMAYEINPIRTLNGTAISIYIYHKH